MENEPSSEEKGTILAAIQNWERFRIGKPANRMRKLYGLPETTEEEVLKGRARQLEQDAVSQSKPPEVVNLR